LKRAIGNVLRNAMLHGAPPIDISAERSNGHIVLSIRTRSPAPGCLRTACHVSFDPVLCACRPPALAKTGGTGLGLAIVKTCIDACGGTVSAKNVEPHGLEILTIITLPKA